MSLVLYIKTALVVTEIFWQGFGTVRIYFYQDECVPLELWHTLRVGTPRPLTRYDCL
ncbi:hypothetical protein IscW_ISCW012641 [Ixodes scapularis]|uniref:Uncharacterized protein n=1 Tax=Ixodes scapularis TaxID=6945 RepID=B7QAE9_IXOSC|nr:hypothetical protein IscW_ISCW012641 [Ixodes scapularis]|eukprot:XP_002400590.1 hypothetical protein IscW_ISCW012641 [Ixodes scapularis]